MLNNQFSTKAIIFQILDLAHNKTQFATKHAGKTSL